MARSWPLVKKLGRNFIVLERMADTFWYEPATLIGGSSGCGCAVSVAVSTSPSVVGGGGGGLFCERRALVFSTTYSVTEVRISMPVTV